MDRKIKYNAEAELKDGRLLQIDLEADRGWMSRPELADITSFVLKPLAVHLPIIHIDLSPFSDGTKKRLVYFSRPYGKINMGAEASLCELFRLYCIGWQATLNGRNVKSLLWIYPTGVVIAADEPKYIDELIEAHWKQRQGKG